MVHIPAEIVFEVLKYAKQDLAPFLRINSQWFHCGISLKWRVAAPEDFDTVEKHRRQIYASVIRGFRIYHANNELFEELSHLSWPVLEMLDIDFMNPDKRGEPADLTDIAYLACYLRPGLKYLHLGGPFDPDLLSLVQLCCPQLQTFSFSHPVPEMTPELLLTFLRDNPSLSDIAIGGSDSPLVTGKTLNYLASRNTIERLIIKCTCNEDAINAIDTPSPFRDLQHLAISATESALPPLLRMIGGIRSFHLDLVKPQNSGSDTNFNPVALNHVSNLVELRELSLIIWGDMMIQKENILPLQNLTQLRRLSIYGRGPPSLLGMTLTPEDFEEPFSKLSKLTHLDFHIFRPDLANDALKILSKCCPLLRHCDILGFFNMLDFERERKPLFPNVEFLSVGGFRSHEPERLPSVGLPYEHVQQIEKHFPNLRQLDCTFRSLSPPANTFTDKVLKLWRMRHADREAKTK